MCAWHRGCTGPAVMVPSPNYANAHHRSVGAIAGPAVVWLALAALASCTGQITGAALGADGQPGNPGDHAPADEPVDEDGCPHRGGVQWQGKTRFMLGVNYAWRHFGGDFGGIAEWEQMSVSQEPEPHRQALLSMKNSGATVVRWWIFPDFRGDGVEFDRNAVPVGVTATALADVETALELADQADVYLMFTLFSFDAFRPDKDLDEGVVRRSLAPIAIDPAKRRRLIDTVVVPVAAVVAASPHRDRVIAWDLINEPEWAMTGPSPYGDPDYKPTSNIEPLLHEQMEAFLGDVIAALRVHGSGLITLGATAAKWGRAWSHLDLDFYQFHIYPWINAKWPYDSDPQELFPPDKAVVMGEYPYSGLGDGISQEELLRTWFGKNYAGALAWQYRLMDADDLEPIANLAEREPCRTNYSATQ
jgi:hypothetical protein